MRAAQDNGMKIIENQSLRTYNTFGIDVLAKYFAEVCSENELQIVLKQNIQPLLLLGGGSNVLLTKNFDGLVIKNSISGIQIETTRDQKVIVSAGAGENWHGFVQWCLRHDFGGVENLSLIPGTVGAAPIQNIGAYGVELKAVFHHLEAMELSTCRIHTFSKEDCQFGYRDSIFKRDLKDKFCITKVYFELTKKEHSINISYGAIKDTLYDRGIEKPTIQELSQAVIAIRSSKLPDPAVIGNAGSFFKNPEIQSDAFDVLKRQFPNLPAFPGERGGVKVPAGWLIEQCGWKGTRRGDAGCYEKQALVLVNYGKAKGEEIWQLARDIADSVKVKFGIQLQAEVNLV